MKRIYTIIGVTLFLCNATTLWAQQGTSASGGDAGGSGGTVSYTIGQTDYITAAGSGGTASEGVQQPYEISVATGIQEKGIELACAIYPNPTTDFVVLSVQNNDAQTMSYTLTDVKGNLIAQQKLTDSKTTISMTDYADALYLLKVFNNNTEVKSFKLIKNK